MQCLRSYVLFLCERYLREDIFIFIFCIFYYFLFFCIVLCIIFIIFCIFYLLAIVRSLIGSPNSVTDSVTISRISVLYDDLINTLKTFNFLNLSFILKVHKYMYVYKLYVAIYMYACMYVYVCVCSYVCNLIDYYITFSTGCSYVVASM